MSKRVSRQGRAQLVVEHLEDYGPCLSELQLATLQNVKKTPHFRSILEELTNGGVIVVQWVDGNNHEPMRLFCLPGQAPRLEGF